MLTKSQITFVRSLHDKSGRNESGCFLVEWEKNMLEFLASSFVAREIIVTKDFAETNKTLFKNKKVTIATEKEIEKISTLESNRVWVAVFFKSYNPGYVRRKWLTLVLDGINDPGNLGTIIRTADWYGIQDIIASHDTVDVYNPKVVMATKGSLTRVHIEYQDLKEFFKMNKHPSYGAFLDGTNVHTLDIKKTEDILLVIGSESHGIRPGIEKYITHRITIPRKGGAESLNAWVATAIILDNFLR